MVVPWLALAGAGVQGLVTGLSAHHAAREDKRRIERENKMYEQAAASIYNRVRSSAARQYQAAAGQVGYLQYVNRGDKEKLGALSDMYRTRVGAGIGLDAEAQKSAAEMLGRKQAHGYSGGSARKAFFTGLLAGGAKGFSTLYEPTKGKDDDTTTDTTTTTTTQTPTVSQPYWNTLTNIYKDSLFRKGFNRR